jgi:hypothetical protein
MLLRASGTLLFLLASLLVLPPRPAYACSCAVWPLPQTIAGADVILLGRVTHVDAVGWPFRFSSDPPFIYQATGGNQRVTIEVSESWKTPLTTPITFITSDPTGAQCGYFFTIGDTYMVYAQQTAQGLQQDFCQRVVPLAQAQADMAALGPGLPPIPTAPASGWRNWSLAALAMVAMSLAAFLAWRRAGRRRGVS